jgi:O-antigen/teichoic acid export membrane protein
MAPEKINVMYKNNIRALIFLAPPVLTLIFIWSGVISWLLVGKIEFQFLIFLYIGVGAFLFNLVSVPAYFMNMGTGEVKWNTISHAVMGLLNGALGWFMGIMLGVFGVAWAYAVAALASNLLLIYIYHKHNGIHIRDLRLSEYVWILIANVVISAISYWLWISMIDNMFTVTIVGFVLSLILVLVVWFHPLRSDFWAILAASFKR